MKAMKCPKCNTEMTETSPEHWHCPSCGKNFHLAFYCRICGDKISKEDFNNYDGLCFNCYDREEADEEEDFGIAPHY